MKKLQKSLLALSVLFILGACATAPNNNNDGNGDITLPPGVGGSGDPILDEGLGDALDQINPDGDLTTYTQWMSVYEYEDYDGTPLKAMNNFFLSDDGQFIGTVQEISGNDIIKHYASKGTFTLTSIDDFDIFFESNVSGGAGVEDVEGNRQLLRKKEYIQVYKFIPTEIKVADGDSEDWISAPDEYLEDLYYIVKEMGTIEKHLIYAEFVENAKNKDLVLGAPKDVVFENPKIFKKK
ncbi:MAG: hypothetical protein ACRC0X_03590 [Brevinema sp.]